MGTEKRLISLDETMNATYKEVFWTESEAASIRSFLVKQPKVDAVEVVHGRWKHQYEKGMSYKVCSICGQRNGLDLKFNYCPNCGADMRERKDND